MNQNPDIEYYNKIFKLNLKYNKIDEIHALLDKNIKLEEEILYSLIIFSLNNNQIEIIEKLLKLNLSKSILFDMFELSCKNNNVEILKILINDEHICNLFIERKDQFLDIVMRNGNAEILLFLSGKGIDIKTSCKYNLFKNKYVTFKYSSYLEVHKMNSDNSILEQLNMITSMDFERFNTNSVNHLVLVMLNINGEGAQTKAFNIFNEYIIYKKKNIKFSDVTHYDKANFNINILVDETYHHTYLLKKRKYVIEVLKKFNELGIQREDIVNYFFYNDSLSHKTYMDIKYVLEYDKRLAEEKSKCNII